MSFFTIETPSRTEKNIMNELIPSAPSATLRLIRLLDSMTLEEAFYEDSYRYKRICI